jgi:hypothetical protein
MHTYSRSIFTAALLMFALLFAPFTHAELLKVDLVAGSSDGKLTRDTLTGLDWLDVTLTVNQNYDQVRTGEFYRQGFRHATKAEVDLLFHNAGLVDDGFDVSFTQPNEAYALIALLGSTYGSPTSANTMGLTGSDFFGNTVTTDNYPIGTRFSALLGKVQYMDLRSFGSQLIGEAHFTGGHPFSDEASLSYGSFLVRPTPTECRTAGRSPNPKCHGQARGQY